MNIFVLDLNTETCARYHCDKHVVKMIVETAQLLSTAQHENGVNVWVGEMAYKRTHKNHPCAIWTRQSLGNYQWLALLGIELCEEYTYRFGKIHKTEILIRLLQSNPPIKFDLVDMTPFAKAMPDQYRSIDAVDSYR